jgi:hypothetical protein
LAVVVVVVDESRPKRRRLGRTKGVLTQQYSKVNMSSDKKEQIERAARVEAAATKAVALVEKFSAVDPSDPDLSNPWRNPGDMWAQLDKARDDIQEAWGTTEEAKEQPDHKVAFTAMYIDLITDSFADVLDDMRKDDAVDVDILVDCLQSGLELLSTEEVDLMMEQEDDMEEEGTLTPHEQRRRELGFHVEEKKYLGRSLSS